MKRFGILLSAGLTFLIIFVVSVLAGLPGSVSSLFAAVSLIGSPEEAEPTITVPVAVDAGQLETTLAEREAAHQVQLSNMDKAWQERETIYQGQIQELTAQIGAVQAQLETLKTQEQALSSQAAQLEQTRADRQASYQAQLEQVQTEYNARYANLQTQLNEAQVRLNEAEAQLNQ